MHGVWFNLGPVVEGLPSQPMFDVNGKELDQLVHPGDFTINIRAVPSLYTVTYRMEFGRTPAAPTHIDDGVRVDYGPASILHNYQGSMIGITAVTFDPTGQRPPSSPKSGRFTRGNSTGVLAFTFPSGHVFASVPSYIGMLAAGYRIDFNWSDEDWPEAPTEENLNAPLHANSLAFTNEGNPVRYITAVGWLNGVRSAPQYMVYYRL